jgi:glucose-6-phosphate 1-epimerase
MARMKNPKSFIASAETIDFHGLPAVSLITPAGATAVITLHGGQLVSWQAADGRERLYLSERSRFKPGQPIRGGIPVIFPQFADGGALPRHGFARTSTWELVSARHEKNYACATLRLTDCDATRAIWPHAFVAELTVMIEGNRLDVEFEVENTGADAFSFSAALHSYFSVASANNCQLQGLDGVCYLDQTAGGKLKREEGETLLLQEEVDRIYLDVGKPLLLWEPARHLAIEAEGFPDVVVWNPWLEKCAALDDMPPDGYRQMICIEAAAVAQPVALEAGGVWSGRQTAISL